MIQTIRALPKNHSIKMKKFKAKFNLIKYFLIIAILFIAVPVFASEFSFDTPDANVSAGEKFKVDLNINTEKESINAVEGKIIFPTDLLELSELREGNSIVNFWVEKPVYKNGEVVFSGITPGGYVMDKGLVLALIFTAKSDGNALIKIENVSALINDGNGSKSILKISNLVINISGASTTKEDQVLNLADKTPPDTFKPEVSRDPNIFDNKWFAAFMAQDKDSGQDRYEIKESRYNIFVFSSWRPAESPYVLTDQELKSNIFIKAIDKAGNERIVKLVPQNPMPGYTNFENWLIIILVIIAVLLYFRFSRKLKKSNEIV
jgi:hypothetical protein